MGLGLGSGGVREPRAELLVLDLAERRRRLLDSGGYVYQYPATPLAETKQRLHRGLDRWVEMVRRRVDDFEERGGTEE